MTGRIPGSPELTPAQVAAAINANTAFTNGDFDDAVVVELVKLRLARTERAISQDGYELWEQVTKAVCDAFRPPASKFAPVVAPPEAPEPQPEPPEYA